MLASPPPSPLQILEVSLVRGKANFAEVLKSFNRVVFTDEWTFPLKSFADEQKQHISW